MLITRPFNFFPRRDFSVLDTRAFEMETPSKYITLVSGDNYEFVVLREAAYISPAIKSMLNTQSECEARVLPSSWLNR